MASITLLALKALSASDDGTRLPDGNSMFGTVRANKNKNSKIPVSVYFQWRCRINGITRHIRIGSWPNLTLQALRNKRNQLAVEVKSGIDPIERKAIEKLKLSADAIDAYNFQLDRHEEIAEKQARLTVRGLFDLWLSLSLKQRKDKGSSVQRSFERDVFPLIGEMAMVDVKKSHILNIIDIMMEREVVRMSKVVLSNLRQMFGFAIDRDYLESNPTDGIKKSKIGPDGERDRVLNEAELIDFFKKLPQSGMAVTSQCALLIQLATITRIGETVTARWENVDFQRKSWYLPVTKNGKPHQIWLSDFALSQFERLREITGATEWVFPNAKLNASLDTKTVTKQVADRQKDDKPMSGRTKKVDALKLSGGAWRPHDLRRTGASNMAELGALSDVIEKCLNHTQENKMKRIYQLATYEEPMRDAWKIWGEKLSVLQKKAELLIND